MGGRGAGANIATDGYHHAKKRYEKDYEPKYRGQITKYEAGIFYKAVKDGNIEAKPEFVNMLYDETTYNFRTHTIRYTQDVRFYDDIERITHSLINNDYKTAQKIVNNLQNDLIKRAGKKSRWYKYK